MKLEKVVSRPKKGLWIMLFVISLAVIGTMATSYNFEVVARMRADLKNNVDNLPWLKITLGTLGFVGILSILLLFFTRLLREMKVSQIQADFLDRISHELRTPLSTLTLVSDFLKSSETTQEEASKLWSSHDLELARLKTDVELLLQAARLREAKLSVDWHLIQLDEWLKEKWPTFQVLLGPNASFKRVGAHLGKIKVDPTLFELILRNLLDNARKFSLEQPVVELRSEVIDVGFLIKKKKWRISVVDQGLGFEPNHQKWLFRRFSRLPFINSELKPFSIPGTGLGLYLSATASRSMGLTLTGQSLGEGKGAQFVLEGNFA